MTMTQTLAGLRDDIVGIDAPAPLLDGTERRYVFLDNAASTPSFGGVLRAVAEFLPWYSGVHRGVGFKALVATRVYDETHRIAARFVGADPASSAVIFVKNTTEAVNKVAQRLSPDDVILSTWMEHHSNDLPWRKHARIVHVRTTPEGGVDLAALRDALARGGVRLVAVSGASNVTGICTPIHDIAEWAHKAGARILVDAAQLAPHRPIAMGAPDDPRRIDFLVFSAHKMYAPFGIGVLIGPSSFFAAGPPDIVGGGTVSYVGQEEIEWAGLPHKEEAGSPNVVGAVALAEAITILQGVGMEAIAEHERELLDYTIPRMQRIPGVKIFGPTSDTARKVGVIPFTVEGLDHALVATILSTEGGIGVRNGNFCAQPYMRSLLGIAPGADAARAGRCDNPILPGMARASFGCYNNAEDADLFLEMLGRIARREYKGRYVLDEEEGRYTAAGFDPRPGARFRFLGLNGSAPAGKGTA